jgi:hypothetical protein
VFEAEEAVGLIRMHREEAPVPPSRHAGAVPPELDAVILSCLEKDPTAGHPPQSSWSRGCAPPP